MKKNRFLLLASILFCLSSCSYFDGFLDNFSSSNYGSLIIDSSTTSNNQNSSSATETPYKNISPLHQALTDDPDFQVGLPSSGDIKVLVIPVQIGNKTFSNEDLEKIDIAFNGTSKETGYESVCSYYNKVSKGALNMEAFITPIFDTGKTQAYYELAYSTGKDIDRDILNNALLLLDDYYDLSMFDYNKDSYIDGIYLIYSCDYSTETTSPWWAWCYDYVKNTNTYDGTKTNLFVWASISFLDDPLNERTRINVNAETLIHETGHLFYLDDYYDYDDSKGPKGGLGGAAMMDSNVGDHDSLSKLLLGWANYTIVEEEGTYTLNPSESSNDCLIIPLRDNENDILGEYLLIDYYTPTGLNKLQAGHYGLFSKSGVRIYHVDARIDSNIGYQKNISGYYTIFSYNNSDTEHKLIDMIEFDNNNSIAYTDYASNSDLFPSNTSLMSHYNYDGEKLGYTISIGRLGDSVKITVTKKEGK